MRSRRLNASAPTSALMASLVVSASAALSMWIGGPFEIGKATPTTFIGGGRDHTIEIDTTSTFSTRPGSLPRKTVDESCLGGDPLSYDDERKYKRDHTDRGRGIAGQDHDSTRTAPQKREQHGKERES